MLNRCANGKLCHANSYSKYVRFGCVKNLIINTYVRTYVREMKMIKINVK
jgi:hypothetical protein